MTCMNYFLIRSHFIYQTRGTKENKIKILVQLYKDTSDSSRINWGSGTIAPPIAPPPPLPGGAVRSHAEIPSEQISDNIVT